MVEFKDKISLRQLQHLASAYNDKFKIKNVWRATKSEIMNEFTKHKVKPVIENGSWVLKPASATMRLPTRITSRRPEQMKAQEKEEKAPPKPKVKAPPKPKAKAPKKMKEEKPKKATKPKKQENKGSSVLTAKQKANLNEGLKKAIIKAKKGKK
tara:strand:- start:326 stop:787 length:462 start_codon:yes stop_codon:yes gene_type:complete